MIKYKYFFGSDERSLNFLNTIYTLYNKVKVVTLEPKKTGRGRKITPNPVQIYCEQNDIEYSYYQEENIYEDMEYGIVASFAKIFTNNFIINNKNASSFDIESLGEDVRKKVMDKTGIKLNWEIKILGKK